MAITFTSRPFASLLAKMGLRAAVSGLALTASICMASAADKVTFLTSWFAQAEHGGFYQAKATGLYEKAGLEVCWRAKPTS